MADSTDHTDRNARLRETLEGLRDDPDALIEIILRQAEQIRELTARVEELEQKVRDLSSETERLRKERDEAERAGKRQAAPFRVEEEKRSEDPDLPGRDEGHEAAKGTRQPTAGSRSRSTGGSRRRWTVVRNAGSRSWRCARSAKSSRSFPRPGRRSLR
jgi:TolA-binding protein